MNLPVHHNGATACSRKFKPTSLLTALSSARKVNAFRACLMAFVILKKSGAASM